MGWQHYLSRRESQVYGGGVMGDRELLSFLKDVREVLGKAFDYDGDVFGILHNQAVDLDCKINRTIAKLEKKG